MIRVSKKVKYAHYKKRTGSYVIIENNKDNKIAIATDNTDAYFFLGGGVEENETLQEALKRELLEETGYSLKNIKFFDKISSYCYSNKYGYIDIEATIYIANFDKKVANPIEKDHKILWVSPFEYKDKLYHEYQEYILNKYISFKEENIMNNTLIYSTTTRCVGEKNNVDNFKLGIQRLESSKFNYANLNFFEIQELLDKQNYEEIFDDIIKYLNRSRIIFNIAHAPIHYPFFFNNYYNRKDIDILQERILKAINISKEVGVNKIVIHVGTYLDENYEYDMQKSIEHNIKYLEPFVKKAIDKNILIAIENGTQMEKDEPLFKNTAPYIDELIKIVEYCNQKYNKEVLGICFDFGHANVGKLDIYNEIKKIGSKLKVTHIHDNYGSDSHNQPFDGTINWTSVRQALSEINYNGELTSEVRYTKEELSNSNNINKTYDLIKKIHLGL